jgi:pimeloyl-ACP methyl ester carboxylesterase
MHGELFELDNAHGQRIKGVLYSPAASGGVGVVYLPGIVLGMTAVHRLGIEFARQLTQDGHVVCLFDPSGIGESEGDYPTGSHQELAAWVEAGHCVDDTVRTLDMLAKRSGARQLVVIGHCGGALTAIYAAARHPAVRGAFLICPPTLEARRGHELDREGVASIYVTQYLHKLASPGAWLRLLRGRSSYGTMIRLVAGTARRRLARLQTRLQRLRPAAPETAAGPPLVFNERLQAALRAATGAGKQVAIVFGDRDPQLAEFRAFQRDHLPPAVSTRIFDATSHGFVTEDSMAALFAEIRRFVGELADPGA